MASPPSISKPRNRRRPSSTKQKQPSRRRLSPTEFRLITFLVVILLAGFVLLKTILKHPPVSTPITAVIRPQVRGKFIFLGNKKVYLKGVTYGTFRPDKNGQAYHTPEIVEKDFTQMTGNNINAVRTYTVPPRWFLDLAQRHGLYVMVGIPWEQHIAFLEEKQRMRLIEDRVRAGVRFCARHPAILCYAIGNEIPASIVRWYGHRRVECFLECLYWAVKDEDPEGLVTYVNYPSTEYLHLPFLDFLSFNVYLETEKQFETYLAHLQNIADNQPLVMTEIGLDSRRNGEDVQAEAMNWQVRTAFGAGCAGVFVFAWTDEWHRGGEDIEDWDFGLTDRKRFPKPALAAVQRAFAESPFPRELPWPHISVVVCSYNGERTIGDCLNGLMALEYPNYEVIVVNDGSTDRTATIAAKYDIHLISTPNQGLGHARNTGMEASTGELIAYLDDDAYPDPHWLNYLATTFMMTSHAAVGGPNIAPPEDRLVPNSVANSPGGPTHVLISDQEAEHIPGCNLAIRKVCLKAIGGFDPQFRIAGDDIDVCWRLQQRNWTIGFNPAAMVWHHRRLSIRSYWKQQEGYGVAEALLAKKWPEKFNSLGYLSWGGKLYSKGSMQTRGSRGEKINYGTWGTGLFQSVYQAGPDFLGPLPQMPEWYLVILALAITSLLHTIWTPLILALPALILAVSVSLIQASLGAARATFTSSSRSWFSKVKLHILTSFLHLIQPLARLFGRLRYGLSPWRQSARGRALPWPKTITIWSERWYASDAWLHSLETVLQKAGACVYKGGNFDRWDLEVRGGLSGSARLLMAIEEHGSGRQLARFRTWPKYSVMGLGLIIFFAVLAVIAILDQAQNVFVVLGIAVILFVVRTFVETAAASATVHQALDRLNVNMIKLADEKNITDDSITSGEASTDLPF